MTSFAYKHIGSWRDGEQPKVKSLFKVSYNQLNDVYIVDHNDHTDFIEWIACTWIQDSWREQREDEETEFYLYDMGVYVTEIYELYT